MVYAYNRNIYESKGEVTMARNDANRCPECGRFGSNSNGGYCTPCHNKRVAKQGEDNYRVGATTYFGYGFQQGDSLFPDKFGVEKERYGYER